MPNATDENKIAGNFIRTIIDGDIAQGKNGGKVHTRFPPEPNGYLHVGHAKAICLNFGVAANYDGLCNLRFDDTNPTKEEAEYARAIAEDVRWLGFDWQERLFHASDYFEQLYGFAIQLIERGVAYVCELSAEEAREYRGTLTEPGRESPYRERSVDENLTKFRRMRAGDLKDGDAVLRARIDMASPNINMRDPIIYRVRHVAHHRTGNDWCIYPMYDFTHCLSDALEGITHSLCTLEFEDHRPLYDWFLDNVDAPCHPQQIEFARLEIDYTITSKRRLAQLVADDIVDGWDDPRLPTISGMRRRGYPPAALRAFSKRIGVTKTNTTIEMAVLESCVRDELGATSPRVMGILNPLKLVITNLPDDYCEQIDAPYHPQKPELGRRQMPFTREVYIERDDFMEEAPRKFFRLRPGGAVRLRYAYIIDCHEVVKNEAGEIIELHCTYDIDTRSGTGTSERRVKGTIQWVSADHALDAEVRLYDRLFDVPNPGKTGDQPPTDFLNPSSLQVVQAKVEPSLAATQPGDQMQFERIGFFCADVKASASGRPVFNRTIPLRDSWAKAK